jgi:hydroxyacylglutathione hydrolase
MTLQVTAIAAFEDNYIWIFGHEGGTDVAVVDPGDAAPVLAALTLSGRKISDILITHHHPDHTGGIRDLLAVYPEARVLGPHNDRIPALTQLVSDNEEVSILGCRFNVMAVPGHTLDHVAYFSNDKNNGVQPVVFCGDTLFSSGCGRLREGTPAQLLESLQRLAALPSETLVYCTHEYTLSNLRFALHIEPDNIDYQERMAECTRLRSEGKPTLPSTIARELRTNPFLRCRSESLSAIIQTQFGLFPASELDVFTHLRRWKDIFPT